VVRDKLDLLVGYITGLVGEDIIIRCFVDSAPILEKAWAQNSGLGFIGKNSCLISPKHGSFVFVAEIITSFELEGGQSIREMCGSCRRCIDACPTQAITENRTINSYHCISYQTIENRDEIPTSLKGKFDHYIFGCDICQDVCPWNRRSRVHKEPLFYLRPEIKDMDIDDWKSMDETTYQKVFKKSAVKRAKFSGLKRNINFVADET
jgi:epoxyqueuosine reductase